MLEREGRSGKEIKRAVGGSRKQTRKCVENLGNRGSLLLETGEGGRGDRYGKGSNGRNGIR